MHIKNQGFTLAEILITIAIIGVIAALTIPTLVNNTNKQQYVSGLLTAYSTLTQATNQLMMDNGGTMVNLSVSPTPDFGFNLTQKYCTKMNCVKTCLYGSDAAGCFTSSLKTLLGTQTPWGIGVGSPPPGAGAILSNGMTMIFNNLSEQCTDGSYVVGGQDVACYSIYVDVNGFRSPNILGRDVFHFFIYRNGIVPAGVQGTYYYGTGNNPQCKTDVDDVDNGEGCAGRIILEGNKMNY